MRRWPHDGLTSGWEGGGAGRRMSDLTPEPGPWTTLSKRRPGLAPGIGVRLSSDEESPDSRSVAIPADCPGWRHRRSEKIAAFHAPSPLSFTYIFQLSVQRVTLRLLPMSSASLVPVERIVQAIVGFFGALLDALGLCRRQTHPQISIVRSPKTEGQRKNTVTLREFILVTSLS